MTRFLNLFGKIPEELYVIIDGKAFANDAPVIRRIGRAGHQRLHQRVAIGGQIGDVVACVAHGAHDLNGPGGRVQSDAIAEASVAVRVVGHDQGDPAIRSFGRSELRPIGSQSGDKVHAAGIRFVADKIGLDPLVEARLRLEGHRAGKNPAIDFR